MICPKCGLVLTEVELGSGRYFCLDPRCDFIFHDTVRREKSFKAIAGQGPDSRVEKY